MMQLKNLNFPKRVKLELLLWYQCHGSKCDYFIMIINNNYIILNYFRSLVLQYLVLITFCAIMIVL